MALVMALVMELVMALAKLAAISTMPESLLAAFAKIRLRTDATDIARTPPHSDMHAFQGLGKTPSPSVIDEIYR